MPLLKNFSVPDFHRQAEWRLHDIGVRAQRRDPVWLSDHERDHLRARLDAPINLRDVETNEVFDGKFSPGYSSKHDPADVVKVLWRIHDKMVIDAVARKFGG